MVKDNSDRPMPGWQYRGRQRPDFAIKPKQGQESVWDYPRPPRLELDTRLVLVKYRQHIIAETRRAYRILETASPPSFYLPPEDVNHALLTENSAASFCEWKGRASYLDYRDQTNRIDNVAWFYRHPYPDFELIKDYISFYPAKVDCFIEGIKVIPQSSRFYGGWITPEIVGPFKGDPGTEGW